MQTRGSRVDGASVLDVWLRVGYGHRSLTVLLMGRDASA
jgi:hypothetical protein